jgi:hypothetical protein
MATMSLAIDLEMDLTDAVLIVSTRVNAEGKAAWGIVSRCNSLVELGSNL